MSYTAPGIELLEAICSIDSRTLEGAEGNNRVSEALGERFRDLGFEVTEHDPLPEEGVRGRHLRAVRHPSAQTRLVFLGHTDTILSPEEVPFRVAPSAGRVYGSGVCDMKGGCVILLEAIRVALAESEAVRQAGLIVLLNSAEETSSKSFTLLAREAAKEASACLGFEPAYPGPAGSHHVVTARKGIVRFNLACFGRAAHAGNNHRAGVNAIRELARKIEQIEGLTDHSRDVVANVGRVSGGRVPNQVPDEASAEFEVRALDAALLEHTCDAVKAICSMPSILSVADGQPTRLELSEHRAYPPWATNGRTDRLAQRYARLAARRGLLITPVASGGGADASYVADLTPTLDGLGPLGGEVHSKSEWADLATWPLRVNAAADMIADLCAGDEA